jgi:hypothetical protein
MTKARQFPTGLNASPPFLFKSSGAFDASNSACLQRPHFFKKNPSYQTLTYAWHIITYALQSPTYALPTPIYALQTPAYAFQIFQTHHLSFPTH